MTTLLPLFNSLSLSLSFSFVPLFPSSLSLPFCFSLLSVFYLFLAPTLLLSISSSHSLFSHSSSFFPSFLSLFLPTSLSFFLPSFLHFWQQKAPMLWTIAPFPKSTKLSSDINNKLTCHCMAWPTLSFYWKIGSTLMGFCTINNIEQWNLSFSLVILYTPTLITYKLHVGDCNH